mgnify:CR=1 FL=1
MRSNAWMIRIAMECKMPSEKLDGMECRDCLVGEDCQLRRDMEEYQEWLVATAEVFGVALGRRPVCV